MHKGLKKGIAVLAAVVLFCGSAPVDIYAANTVTISTRKDFLRFAKNCTLDSWSAGKTVVLTADIDLGRVNFSPIPIFGGTFEGNGHTISGLNLEQDGSQLGLFRYVAEGGVVKNLKVEGNVTPGGSRSSIGGIVGENNGTITGCSFDGTVEGKDTVGGVVGKNKGEVRECSASGEIHGELSVGGIAGENNGFLAECRNEADVNTEYEEKKQELSDIDTDAAAILEKYRISKENTERSNLMAWCRAATTMARLAIRMSVIISAVWQADSPAIFWAATTTQRYTEERISAGLSGRQSRISG